jgi:hypothetical protein
MIPVAGRSGEPDLIPACSIYEECFLFARVGFF